MPNLAARVAGLAHAGQILVEGTSGFITRAGSSEKGGVGSGVGAALSGLADRSYKRDDMVTVALSCHRTATTPPFDVSTARHRWLHLGVALSHPRHAPPPS